MLFFIIFTILVKAVENKKIQTMKEKIKAALLKIYPYYKEHEPIEFDALKNNIGEDVNKHELWRQIISMNDEGIISIEDGLTQRITILPGFYK